MRALVRPRRTRVGWKLDDVEARRCRHGSECRSRADRRRIARRHDRRLVRSEAAIGRRGIVLGALHVVDGKRDGGLCTNRSGATGTRQRDAGDQSRAMNCATCCVLLSRHAPMLRGTPEGSMKVGSDERTVGLADRWITCGENRQRCAARCVANSAAHQCTWAGAIPSLLKNSPQVLLPRRSRLQRRELAAERATCVVRSRTRQSPPRTTR